MLALGTASFALFGALLVLVGSTHAEISADLGLTLGQVNLLGASVSLGLAGGLLVGGPVVDHFPRRPVYQGSLALAGASLLGFHSTIDFSAALLLVTLTGFGAGAYETVLNTTVIARYRERATRPIAFLHAAATVGAVVTPGLIGWLIGEWDWSIAFRLAGLAHFGLIAASFAVEFESSPAIDQRDADDWHGATDLESAQSMSLASPLMVWLCVAGFAYVGLETAMTLLAVPYAAEVLALPSDAGRGAISAFWFGLLAGRAALFALGRNAGPLTLCLAGVASAGVLCVGVLGEISYFSAVMATLGFSLGSVFPLLISLAGQLFASRRGTAIGLVGGIASIGGFVLPAATGFLGDAFGVRLATLSLAVACAAIALGGGLAHRASSRFRSTLRTRGDSIARGC